ncbi:MAG: c-type cytochrome biogenesis protein CcsB [Mycobacteriales bacterium]
MPDLVAAAADAQLGTLSDNLLFAAVLTYSVAMLLFAAEFAFTRRLRATVQLDHTVELPDRATSRVLVGATAGRGAGEAPLAAAEDGALFPAEPPATSGVARLLGWLALALTVLGWGAHVGSVVTRGMAAHRVPWGNMYEFSSTVALAAVTAFLVLTTRERVRYLGAFVLFPVVLYLGLAGTVLYVPAAPLVPALQSYWIKIHVVAAVSASGIFMVGAVVTALYLLRSRLEALVTAGRRPGLSRLAGPLPSAAALDRTAYRVIAFAFPVWTFAVIAGAIWAEAAWGRYWGWDPKETWSFITWVIYAGYLHARATAGWKGTRAAGIALVGFAALMIDYYAVNIWIVGLHSYAK